MIAQISGKIIEKGDNYLLLNNGAITYEILIPLCVMQRLNENALQENNIHLVTYHYYQVEPSRSTPVLIGFLNKIEKEFFEAFITVSGIGPRAAVKALNQPISLIAQAIDSANLEFLKSLPWIGQQRAKEIVAKLQNKVGKFALMQDGTILKTPSKTLAIEEEVLAILMQLEYKKAEAHAMIKKALGDKPGLATTEELLNEVYKQRRLT